MSGEPERRFEPWPVAIALFLATVIVVNIVFITVAVNHNDEISPDYLVQENRQ